MKLNRQNLKSIILEVLGESQYYHDALGIDIDYAEQALELGQSMQDGGRDRAEQVNKYVSLKVTKVLKDAIKTETIGAIEALTHEAMELYQNFFDKDDWSQEKFDELKSLYERAFTRPLKALREFDGTQDSLDKWIDAVVSVERVLMKSRDPAMYYLGKISPDYFTISDSYSTNEPDEDDDWGDDYDRKTVDPKTAVKEAEEFFRPAIMKTVMGIQTRETGVDVGEMFGLNENEEELEAGEKEHLVQLLSGDEEAMRQGIALADMLIPDLMDKVNEMDEEDQLPRIFLKLFKEEVQKELDKYYKWRTWTSAKQDYDIAKHITREDSDLWTVDTVPDDNWDLHGKTIAELFNLLQFKYNRWTWGLIYAAVDIIVKRFDEVDKAGLSTYFYGFAGDSIVGVLEKAFKDRSILGPYIEKWKASELVKLIK